MTDEEYLEIWELAVQNNGSVLQYIPKYKRTAIVCNIAIYKASEFIPKNMQNIFEIKSL
jgi:hypothetical protein